MGHRERCYHTTAPVALALGGLWRMEACLGAAFDRHFISALIARLPGIAEQGRARSTRTRGLQIYTGALEHGPVGGARAAQTPAGLRARAESQPRLPRPRFSVRP